VNKTYQLRPSPCEEKNKQVILALLKRQTRKMRPSLCEEEQHGKY